MQAAEILQMLDKMVGMKYTIPEGVEVSRECCMLVAPVWGDGHSSAVAATHLASTLGSTQSMCDLTARMGCLEEASPLSHGTSQHAPQILCLIDAPPPVHS